MSAQSWPNTVSWPRVLVLLALLGIILYIASTGGSGGDRWSVGDRAMLCEPRYFASNEAALERVGELLESGDYDAVENYISRTAAVSRLNVDYEVVIEDVETFGGKVEYHFTGSGKRYYTEKGYLQEQC